jgi:hypothetical protein
LCQHVSAFTVVTTADLSRGILWDNGPFVTHPGQGFEGANISKAYAGQQAYAGYPTTTMLRHYVAEDFTVGEPGWYINRIVLYATLAETSPTISGVSLRIWDGVPENGGTVRFGDDTTNYWSSMRWSGAYRIRSDGSFTDTSMRIMIIEADVNWYPLGPGTYWLEWGFTAAESGVALMGTIVPVPPVSHADFIPAGNALSCFGVCHIPFADDSGVDPAFPFTIMGNANGFGR